ncbi:PAS domain S-box protein [Candidatus Sumerlaeota bacterium]|nr:PAS domain S-box protein [Candidatus Sumerlaeota bacterium]
MAKRKGSSGFRGRSRGETEATVKHTLESEETARAILNGCPFMAFLLSSDGVLIDLNEAMARSVGCEVDQVRGVHGSEIIDKEIWDQRWPHFEEAIRTGKRVRFEDQRANRHFITTIHPLLNPSSGDRVTRLVGFAEDVTDRHRIEEALTESEEKYRSLVENLNIGVFRSTPETPGRILHANEAMARIFGYDTPEEMLQAAPLDFYLNPEDRSRLIEDLRRHGLVRNREMLHRRRDGTPFWASFTASAHFDARGNMDWLEGIVEDISQRKWALEMLRESEKRYRTLFSQAPDSVCLIDADTGAFVEFNERAHRGLGYTREEFESLRIQDIEAEESPEAVVAHIERLLRCGSEHFETRHRTKSGEIRDVRVSARTLTLQGKIFVHTMWQDVTANKRTERAFRESESRSRATLAALPDLLFRISEDGVFLECHAPNPRLLLLPQEQIPGKTLWDTLPPELAERTERLIRRTLETGELQAYEYTLTLGKERRIHEFEARMVPCGEHEILVLDRDITERKKLLRALEQSEETAHTLLDASPLIAALFDTDGVFLAANEPLLRSLNRSADQVIRFPLSAIFRSDVATSRLEHLRRAVELGEPVHFEDEREHRIFKNTYCPIVNEDGEVFRVAAFSEDVTRQRLNEHLAALGMTASNLAHSIKNIQSHLMGATDVIDDALTRGDLEKIERAWPLLRRSSQRISGLVRDMLSIARGGEVDREPVDLNQLVGDILDSCRTHAAESEITLTSELDESIGEIPLDFIRTHEALLNLVGNAIEAIEWTHGHTGAVHIRTRADRGALAVEVQVTDNGPGFPPEIRDRLFDAFFTTKGSRGSGLGLAVVKKAVEEMGGTIHAESKLGQGSVFIIRLPMS